jgi:tetrahydromethanopterin S-methyltransferase subunit F
LSPRIAGIAMLAAGFVLAAVAVIALLSGRR